MTSSALVVLFYRYFLPTSTSSATTPDGKSNDHTRPSATGAAAVDEATLLFFQIHSSYYLPRLENYQLDLCRKLGNIKGRILLSPEGINGTLYCSRDELSEYVGAMESFDLLRDIGVPYSGEVAEDGGAKSAPPVGFGRLFANIDWKTSVVAERRVCGGVGGIAEPFPDLKVQVVKEIVYVKDIPRDSGEEISPEEFHQILMDSQQGKDGAGAAKEGKDVVLIDVRNTFEHSIGHFVHPKTDQDASSCLVSKDQDEIQSANRKDVHAFNNVAPTPAVNPNTVTFSHFDSTFCSQAAASLKNKRVLMYCTGGIRCVKASAMLKQRGVEDVSHLSGGIHRYVERYGSGGFYKGKVFVFDQRVALNPNDLAVSIHDDKIGTDDEVVGKCINCQTSYDQISGNTICTVCRDLLVLCPSCKSSLNEYHCERHRQWKKVYFTFLERFSAEELSAQHKEMQRMHDTIYVPAKEHKNVRRTLRKQMEKVVSRIKELQEGTAVVERNAKRRCRTCFESEDVCDGLCWGFWRSSQMSHELKRHDIRTESLLEIHVGDRVVPGPHWNTLRHGSRCYSMREYPLTKRHRHGAYTGEQSRATASNHKKMKIKVGTVVEVKSWASGGTEMDCVVVSWDANSNSDMHYSCQESKGGVEERKGRHDITGFQQRDIYRWGTVARNGKRLYDVKVA